MAPKRMADEEADEDQDWNAHTVAQLKSELKARGLFSTGRKCDLVARLKAHDNSEAVETARPSKRAKKVTSITRNPTGARTQNSTPKAKSKRKKKAARNDLDVEDPLAADIIVHKNMNHETGERRQRDFVPAPNAKFKATSWRIRNERMFMLDRQLSQDRKGHVCQKCEPYNSWNSIPYIGFVADFSTLFTSLENKRLMSHCHKSEIYPNIQN
jgi:hypothetical protein